VCVCVFGDEQLWDSSQAKPEIFAAKVEGASGASQVTANILVKMQCIQCTTQSPVLVCW
jgi:hypothetical protein